MSEAEILPYMLEQNNQNSDCSGILSVDKGPVWSETWVTCSAKSAAWKLLVKLMSFAWWGKVRENLFGCMPMAENAYASEILLFLLFVYD